MLEHPCEPSFQRSECTLDPTYYRKVQMEPSPKQLQMAPPLRLHDLPTALLFHIFDFLKQDFLCLTVSSPNRAWSELLTIRSPQSRYWLECKHLEPQLLGCLISRRMGECFTFRNVRLLNLDYRFLPEWSPVASQILNVMFPSFTSLYLTCPDEFYDPIAGWLPPLVANRPLTSFTGFRKYKEFCIKSTWVTRTDLSNLITQWLPVGHDFF